MSDPASQHASFFTRSLLEWYHPDRRPLPWKGIDDPYRIWLSEVILQQTRVEQGLPYYERFVEAYPTVCDLARAPEVEVMKLWEGLGYYSRAQNMHAAARAICHQWQGHFPTTHADILQLKGVGPYTAAAIASFAFNLPYAVVDGNVYRVLARFFGIEQPTNTTEGKKRFTALAQQLLAPDEPGRYNQAIMDFGATVCTPQQPRCADCPLQIHCTAHQTDRTRELPQKKPKAPRRLRYFHFLLFNHQGAILIRQRKEKDVWQKLFDFPALETNTLLNETQLLARQQEWPVGTTLPTPMLHSISKPFRQLLSHQDIRARFFELSWPATKPLITPENGKWVPRDELGKYPFPRIIDWYLSDNSLYLNL